jgi:hypothetical protein
MITGRLRDANDVRASRATLLKKMSDWFSLWPLPLKRNEFAAFDAGDAVDYREGRRDDDVADLKMGM